MPVTISARKKMRQDKKRRLVNLESLNQLKRTVTKVRKTPSLANLKLASSVIDRAAKKGIIHQKKAARLKARLAKKITSKPIKKPKK